MQTVTVVVITILTLIGLLHFYWAFGGTVGLHKALPTINGKPMIKPGKRLTFFVGVVMIGFGALAYMLAFYDIGMFIYGDSLLYLGWMVSSLFILRAIGEFHAVGFFKKVKSSEFATYDTWFYSPLCSVLGVVFAILTLGQM